MLWDILPVILTSKTLHITYVEKPSKKETEKYHIIKPLWSANCAKMLTTNNHIAAILTLFSEEEHAITRKILENKRVVFIDASLPKIEFAQGALGNWYHRKFMTFNWGDPLKTNEKQLIVCDTRQIDTINFSKNSYILNNEDKKNLLTQLPHTIN